MEFMMKRQILAVMLSLLTIQVIGSEVSTATKIEKYLGSCEIVNSSYIAHLTYVSESGYEDGYSNKGVIVEFTNNKGVLVPLTEKISRIALSGFENEVKIKNKWNKFTLEKDGNMFGGAEGELKINKIKKTGKIDYEYKCYRGSSCGEYEVEMKLINCKLDLKLKGKKIK